MTFDDQVEALTGLTISSSGTNPTEAQLSQFLTDGVKDVIRKLIASKPGDANKFAITSSDASNAGIVVEGDVVGVVREHDSATILRKCSQMDPQHRYEATDKDSLSYRTQYNPGWYVLDGKIYSVPVSTSGNNALKVTQISFPAVAYGDSSIGASYKSITAVAGEADDEVFTLNSHGFSNGDKVRLSGFAGDTALNGIVSIIESVTTNTFKLANVTIDADSTGGTVELVTAGFPGEYEYLVPIYAGIKSLENAMANETLPSDLAIPVLPTIDSPTALTAPSFEYIEQVMGDLYQSATTTYIDTDEDVELAQAKLAQANLEVNSFQAKVQQAMNKMQEDMKEYDSKLQRYQAESGYNVQKHQSEANSAITKFQAEVQDYQARIQKSTADYQWMQGRYAALLQQYYGAFGSSAPQQKEGKK